MLELDRYLYRVRLARPGAQVDPDPVESAAIQAHFEYLMALAAAGSVKFIGRTLNEDENAFGIVVFEAESEQAARNVMQGDPAVTAGVMHAELFPFRIVFPR